jgi:hypothetical protein
MRLHPLFSAGQSTLLAHIVTGERYILGRFVLDPD